MSEDFMESLAEMVAAKFKSKFDEIKTAESILKKIALHMNKDLLVMICGSYRRGRDKSGDVDCLIAHPLIKTKSDLENNPTNLLESFVEVLMNYNFIIMNNDNIINNDILI